MHRQNSASGQQNSTNINNGDNAGNTTNQTSANYYPPESVPSYQRNISRLLNDNSYYYLQGANRDASLEQSNNLNEIVTDLLSISPPLIHSILQPNSTPAVLLPPQTPPVPANIAIPHIDDSLRRLTYYTDELLLNHLLDYPYNMNYVNTQPSVSNDSTPTSSQFRGETNRPQRNSSNRRSDSQITEREHQSNQNISYLLANFRASMEAANRPVNNCRVPSSQQQQQQQQPQQQPQYQTPSQQQQPHQQNNSNRSRYQSGSVQNNSRSTPAAGSAIYSRDNHRQQPTCPYRALHNRPNANYYRG